MIQVKKRATPEQLEAAVVSLRAARENFFNVFCGDTVLTRTEVDKCMGIDGKFLMMILDLIDVYKERGGDKSLHYRVDP